MNAHEMPFSRPGAGNDHTAAALRSPPETEGFIGFATIAIQCQFGIA
jgi:hypothetical protein